MSDCAELLRRYVEDNAQDAFTELVRQRGDFVYAVALRQLGGDGHLAADVTQRVFTDLARKARELSVRSTVSGWLYLPHTAQSLRLQIVFQLPPPRHRGQNSVYDVGTRRPAIHSNWINRRGSNGPKERSGCNSVIFPCGNSQNSYFHY